MTKRLGRPIAALVLSHDELRRHLQLFINAYNRARRLKTLRGLTPYQFVIQQCTKEPKRFKVNPLNHTPGPNIIQVAVGHPNRIVTPFEAPRVVTTAAASVETSANVIYVAPTGPALITMFLTETGDESVSISLTLQPRQIPPRELRLELPAGVFVPRVEKTSRPRHGGNERAYIAHAGQIFDQLARGQVPLDVAFGDEVAPFRSPGATARASSPSPFGRARGWRRARRPRSTSPAR